MPVSLCCVSWRHTECSLVGPVTAVVFLHRRDPGNNTDQCLRFVFQSTIFLLHTLNASQAFLKGSVIHLCF